MFLKINIFTKRFSKHFWMLMAASFIDMLGGSLIFPFFSLFMTQKFHVGMTEVGGMFFVWALTSGVIGNVIGGALADRFGRKTNMILGLVASATSALLMVLIQNIVFFYIAIAIVGIFEDIAGPARQAMIADLVPEPLRDEAYGIFRIVFNLAAAIGPAIGGFMATRSFELLFYADVALSLSVAAFVYLFLAETKPASEVHFGEQEATFMQTMKGYRVVLKDKIFMDFVGISILSTLMYFNLNSTLSVFLVHFRNITPAQFGYLLSLNAIMVVLLQITFTRITTRWPPFLTIATGNLLYVIGFGMYGVVNSYSRYILAMVVITIGEMICAPKEQSMAANLSPNDMRARYMAVRSFAWIIPVAIGPMGAGLIMDHLNPNLVWAAAALSGMLSVIGFLRLHKLAGPVLDEKANSKLRGELVRLVD